MARPRTCRRLLLTLTVLTAALAGAALAPTRADELQRLNLGPPADAKPVVVAADDVATWPEAGEQVFLLRGKVLVGQGMTQLRAERAVLWVDLAGPTKTGVYRVQLVADGDVRIEDGPKHQSGATVFAELTTRQEVRLRPGARPPVQQPQGTDPFFRRALALRLGGAPPAGGVQLTSATAPATPATPAQGPTAVSPPPIAVLPPATPPPTLPPPQAGTPLPMVTIPGGVGPMPGPPPDTKAQPGPPRTLSIKRRTAAPYNAELRPRNGENVFIANGGVILVVRGSQDGRQERLLDIEADRLILWTRGDSNQLVQELQSAEGHTGQEVEVYLEGNVEIRSADGGSQTILRAERVYYDVRRSVAVAVAADLELRRRGFPEPLHLRADELYKLPPKVPDQARFEAVEAEVFASRLPSDPGLKVHMARATIEDHVIPRQTIFGAPVLDPKTGLPETYTERLVRGEDVLLRLEDVPIFYLPVLQGDANDPLGPLQSLGFKNDRIFGVQVFSTFDVWNLLNRNPLPGTRWSLEADYLSHRGPALGTNYEYAARDLFGLTGPSAGLAKLYGIHDTGTDILGGGRGENDDHPDWRGRLLLRHAQTFFDEFTLQAQLSLLSDKNFLEQYYKQEFDTDLNQQTFLYISQVHDIYSWSGLLQPHVRNWVTEDVWLPRVDGSMLGRSFFDLFTYNVTANAGYAELRPTSIPPPPTDLQPTDRNDALGRFDVSQELSLPFYLGPVRVVPYGVLDLTYYTDNLNGDSDGRLYGGGGVRGSMPLSRLYPNVQSELFNLHSIYHKVVLSSNYFIAHSNDPFSDFPLLDRLNDDATDQALRDITPRQPFLNPAHGIALATSPLYNSQLYAIRRLLDSSVDTRDTIEVLQTDLRQRWQTKRGFPGQEHVIDYLTLDLSASFFPHPDRDNFGKNVAFLEYDTTWNVGDRTALVSSGWYDPIDNGARVFTIGAQLNRTDRTAFFVGYRLIDPIDSRALTTAATYVFSPKYAITAASTYDFGINESLSNSLIVTRMGSDLTMSLGFTYNALLRNFGFTIELLPNVVAMNRRTTTGLLSRSPLR